MSEFEILKAIVKVILKDGFGLLIISRYRPGARFNGGTIAVFHNTEKSKYKIFDDRIELGEEGDTTISYLERRKPLLYKNSTKTIIHEEDFKDMLIFKIKNWKRFEGRITRAIEVYMGCEEDVVPPVLAVEFADMIVKGFIAKAIEVIYPIDLKEQKKALGEMDIV